MNSERVPRIAAVIALLVIGMLIYLLWMRTPSPSGVTPRSAALLLRPLDTVIQLALMLVCALGIRALLPGENQEEEDGDGWDR